MNDFLILKKRRIGYSYGFYDSIDTINLFNKTLENYYNNLPYFLKEENNKNEINKEMKDVFYVKESDVPLTVTRKDFIRKFIRSKAPSWNDSGCTDLQCQSGRYRSITELHSIVLSRFPKTSFDAILRIVRDLINEDNPVTMVFCNDVKKVVLKYLDKGTNAYISNYSRSNFYETKGVDGYSLSDYEQLINKL